jgi:hypothetical protein
MHPNIYICLCLCVCVTRLYIHYPCICICENRPTLCMRAPVCDGDGSAVCARVGGRVLRARPKTRNPKPCEPCPSAWTACGFGAQAFTWASAFNANIGAWNTASVTTLSSVCAAFPARAARHRGRDALGGASPICARTSCVCAQTCGHARASPCVGIAARSKDGLHVCV